ncbi:MAG: fructosamine kinase family protein [Phycisphaerales bacterium]|nr:fructosamine kinase family protein [Phycisphaerales bacterium]MDP6987391.1 fructosamine kinase family protein [Phycisphaerales bacterium]
MTIVQSALRELGLPSPCSAASLSGGSIHDVRLVQLEGGDRLVCKVAAGGEGLRMLQAAHRDTRQLAATGTVRVPLVHGLVEQASVAVLVMEYLPRSDNVDWVSAGRSLARLHAVDAGQRYGSEHEVWLGGTVFAGGWCDTWPEFLAEHRFRPLLRDVTRAELLGPSEFEAIETLINRLPELVPSHPRPSLLHGDLWSGNLQPTQGGVAVLDPACFIGDSWADPAMTMLFGGVPEAFVGSWREASDRHDPPQQVQTRIATVQAMHLLNHVRLFGTGYTPRLMEIASSLL